MTLVPEPRPLPALAGSPGPASQRTALPLAPGLGRFLVSSSSGLSGASTEELVPSLQKSLS